MGLLTSTLKHVVLVLLLYIVIIAVAIQEPIQSKLIYLNWVNLPLPSTLSDLKVFNFKPYEVHNFKLASTDQVQIGVWQLLANELYNKEVAPALEQNSEKGDPGEDLDSRFDTDFYKKQLANPDFDVVLYLHGNAGNRGSEIRFPTYRAVTKKLNCNLVVLDYRGFGDSSGSPSELGLFQDSLIVFDYLKDLGVPSSRISIMGHSLGTGVAIKLTHYLNSIGIEPRSLILTAPYTSIYDVMFDYRLFKFIPLLLPLKNIPNIDKFAHPILVHNFDSISFVDKLKVNTLMFHGTLDSDIAVQHSHHLFDKVKTKHQLKELHQDVKVQNEKHVTNKFVEVPSNGASKLVGLVELHKAGHNDIPTFDTFASSIAQFWSKLQ